MMCKSNTTVVTSSTGISYSLWARKFTPLFWWCLCCRLIYYFLRSILPPMVYHLTRLFCHCIAIVCRAERIRGHCLFMSVWGIVTTTDGTYPWPLFVYVCFDIENTIIKRRELGSH
jgi:hypothetical protein